MDSKKLEILMTAVNLGSFSKASEVVGYTQSGLTHLINGLEREIGMTLIRRDHSGISLTENGVHNIVVQRCPVAVDMALLCGEDHVGAAFLQQLKGL